MDASALRDLLKGYNKDVNLDDAALQGSFDDPSHGTAFKEWVQVHLGHDNLLSRDELALYLSLDRSGQVDQLVESRNLASVEAAGEDDVRIAVEELGKSTTAIKKQSEMLKQHRAALTKLVDGHGKADQARSMLEDKRTARLDAEQRRKNAAVEELSQMIGLRAEELEQQLTTADETLHQTVDGLFQSDDRLLSSLQKLSRELVVEDPEEKQNIEKLRGSCIRLIKYAVEKARTMLDRLYLEALASAQRDDSLKTASTQEVNELQEEVESLYAEILPVAQMSVEQQYLEPALKSLSDKNGQTLDRSTAAVIYINGCIDFLVNRTARLSSHIDTLRSHQSATSSLVDSARAELAVPIPSPKKRALPSQPTSPVRPRSNTAGVSTPGHYYRHASSDMTPLQNEQPIDALLRSLAISLTSDHAPSSSSLGPDAVAALSRIQSDRAAKASDIGRGAHENVERSVAAHLLDARCAVQLLRDSVLAESSFGEEVRLVDPGIEGSIVVLGQEVSKVRERVETLEAVTAKAKKSGSEKQREMVDRWGR